MMNQVTTKKVRKVNRGRRKMERWNAFCARSTKVRMSTNRMRAARAARMGEKSQERACGGEGGEEDRFAGGGCYVGLQGEGAT